MAKTQTAPTAAPAIDASSMAALLGLPAAPGVKAAPGTPVAGDPKAPNANLMAILGLGPSPAVTSQSVSPPTAATTPASTPDVNPLSTQLYFAQTIAPMLQALQQRQDTQSGALYGAAEADLNKFHMPDEMRALFSTGLAQNKEAASTLNNSLAASAITAPALDQLMNQLNAVHAQQVKNYFETQKAAAGGSTDAASILASLGINVPGTTTTPAATPSTTPAAPTPNPFS